MKALLFVVIGLLLATSAGAVGLAVGPYVTTQTEDGDGTAGPMVSGYFALMPKVVIQLGYEASGEGAGEAMTRLGGHYSVLTSLNADVTLGGGFAIRGFGVEMSENGGFASVAVQTKNATGNPTYRFGVDVNMDFSRQPKPSVTLSTAVVLPLPF
jgi:hypothetical protein